MVLYKFRWLLFLPSLQFKNVNVKNIKKIGLVYNVLIYTKQLYNYIKIFFFVPNYLLLITQFPTMLIHNYNIIF